jgi:hypothetical protein
MTQIEINNYLFQIETATKVFTNDSDLGGVVRQLMSMLEKEGGTSLLFNKSNHTPDNLGDADDDITG